MLHISCKRRRGGEGPGEKATGISIVNFMTFQLRLYSFVVFLKVAHLLCTADRERECESESERFSSVSG